MRLVKADDDPGATHSGARLALGAAAHAGSGRGRRVHTIGPVSAAISVTGLHKAYGDFEAVRGLDLEVETGEVFAFLGPNGAGKTTTTEILEGYRDRSSGEVKVLGADPASAGREWRERIGIVLQQCRMRPELTVRETLSLYAGYYRDPLGIEETIGTSASGRRPTTGRGGSPAASCAASTSASP